MMEHGDKVLLEEAAGGDRRAFSSLVERHHRTVVLFAQRFLGFRDAGIAEDLAQDVFLSAWAAARSFRGDSQVLTWLLRITTNACLNYRRSARLRRVISLDDQLMPAPVGSDLDDPQGRTAARERTANVTRAVSCLPPNQRAAVLLRHFDGLCYADIADVLGTSVLAVESLLFRARRNLREKLTPDGEASPQVLPDTGVEGCGVDISQ